MKQIISMLLTLTLLMGAACAEQGLQRSGDTLTGSYGYTISCDGNVDAYNSEGCDNFVLNQEDGTMAVAISISLIPAIAMEDTKQYALGGHGAPCVLGVDGNPALRARNEADVPAGMVREATLCPLTDGSGLLIDVLWATGSDESTNAALASDMLATFKLTANASSKKIDYIYGLLKAIDTKDMLLSYQEAEVIYDTDAKRIEQLKTQGVELDMPNGHTVYSPVDFILAQPYSQQVEVCQLNDAYVLEASDIACLSERLEGHPEFLLCKLGLVNGNIVTIEEVYLP